MPRWGLIVEETGGFRDRRWEAFLLGEFDGTREDALAKLLERAKAFKPEHPRIVRRQTIYAIADGYLVMSKGATETFHHRFSVAELVHDTDPKKG
ncbi:hypothetical protein G4Z16_07080 [Streptomyces bathyalis]|uniref:Uncharacterized protein n=1 Tax=Streptomyces bathyalis TaxID=2710756 RepID=A0A7T1T4F5_9ACTN|nr:hypothetical protein [Streptomyces bathyalis]QPP06195.1 hypothetical protein G4Z16_07080 [Streptomyces bathyalis]